MLLEPVFYADYIMINADAMFIFKKDMDRSNQELANHTGQQTFTKLMLLK